MTTLREAAQQALVAMDKATRYMSFSDHRKLNEAIDVLKSALEQPEDCGECNRWQRAVLEQGEVIDQLKAALEQPEQEPEAFMYVGIKHDGTTHGPHLVWKPEHMDAMSAEKGVRAVPLFTHPPRRETEQEPVAYLYHDASTPQDAHPWLHSTMLVLAADRRPGLRGEIPLFAHPHRNEANHE